MQAATYSHQLSNLQLLVGFIRAHRHAQDVLTQHINVSCQGAALPSVHFAVALLCLARWHMPAHKAASAALMPAVAARTHNTQVASAALGRNSSGLPQNPSKQQAQAQQQPRQQQQQQVDSIIMEHAGDDAVRGGAEALFVLRESQGEVAAALALAEALTTSHPSLPAW